LNFDTTVHIRPATQADIPHMMSLERQSPTAGHWTEELYRKAFQPESAARHLLVAEVSDLNSGTQPPSILGFLIAHHLAPEWELENLVVAPEARRKGLGKRLLNALLRAARETKSSVFLEVRESNAAARALYESAGFKQTGRRHPYYKSPLEDAILYRWTVT
jgi:ribosomal-protein-alanine N-acetyltransferase